MNQEIKLAPILPYWKIIGSFIACIYELAVSVKKETTTARTRLKILNKHKLTM